MVNQVRSRLDLYRGKPRDVRLVSQQINPEQFAIRHRNISSASGVLTLDLGQANSFACTLTENITSIDINGPMRADEYWFYYLQLTQDSTNRTVTWPAAFLFSGGTEHVMSTGSGSIDAIRGYSIDGGTTWPSRFELDLL